jgi:hypothetical protein
MKGTRWKKLTRGDLTHFDDIGRDAILTAMERGGIGRVSGRGHATIRGAAGGTMSVTRNTNGRVADNIRSDLQRLFPESTQNGTPTKDKGQQMQNDSITDRAEQIYRDPMDDGPTQVAPPAEDALRPCPAKGCDKEFYSTLALNTHIETDHAVCTWEGPDVEHDNPDYRCDLGPNGVAFVGGGLNPRQSVAGHVNIQHKGNKPWLMRDNDPAARKASAKKGAATRAAKYGTKAEVEAKPEPEPPITAYKDRDGWHPVPEPAPTPPPVAKVAESKQPEHRGLPTGTVQHKPASPAAKLAAIRAILGDDPKVAALQAEVEELRAHLDLVREALSLDSVPSKKKRIV